MQGRSKGNRKGHRKGTGGSRIRIKSEPLTVGSLRRIGARGRSLSGRYSLYQRHAPLRRDVMRLFGVMSCASSALMSLRRFGVTSCMQEAIWSVFHQISSAVAYAHSQVLVTTA